MRHSCVELAAILRFVDSFLSGQADPLLQLAKHSASNQESILMTPRFSRNASLQSLPKIAQDPLQFKTLLSAEEYRLALLEQIAEAKSRIYIVALYLEDDQAGRSIMEGLYSAKQRNPELEVVVLVDWHRAQRGLIGDEQAEGNAAMYREYEQRYPGLITFYGVPVSNRELFGVLHLKGSIIDDTVVYSGASINNIYLAQQQRYRFDRYHLIDNARLANAMVDYVEQYLVNSEAVSSLSTNEPVTTRSLKPAIRRLRLSLQREQYSYYPQQCEESEVGITPLLGLGRRQNLLNKTIRQLIIKASHQITLCTPYFNPPGSLSREISKALKNGVKVKLIVGDKTASDFYSKPDENFKVIHALPYLYELNLSKFVKRQLKYINSGLLSIHLWSHQDNSFHVKGLWVDERYSLLTGNNLNPRAWNLDLENGLLIDDPKGLLSEQKEVELNNILAHTKLVHCVADLDSLANYPLPVKRLLKRINRVRADRLLKQIL
ncbi:CDP-diacylglycerol--serine O-phosphatidyltransferase [Agarivorans sp. B2Z047]|uniref:CDP-diacylglycerol--serine O-phosphatidyltransferase n=1 Tax=Agarivorans sp. B2Z047 TaxID=2652721 RepID=UPI0014068D74|nr:CDP-diacylglycerol--serine O-phosphatidyltransferase [Agarivorans sp. B2Z047]MPW30454.1 CDP-diacylglycerol--serine O-phosphatidyltransferase [Agarivorans sp. B2Z047]UQN42919.1 CDP-diacylglycerol--serine O-phosphatidyltransferase [Agarivorans sp. B2Z047]